MADKMHILVVDDELLALDLFQLEFDEEIESGRIQLSVASGVDNAVDILRKGHEDEIILILSDINMPEKSGFDLLKEVSGRYAWKKFYMISAYGSDQTIQKSAELGADRFFVKPLDFDRLRDAIHEDFGQHLPVRAS